MEYYINPALQRRKVITVCNYSSVCSVCVGAVRQDEEATLGEELMTAFHDIGEKPGCLDDAVDRVKSLDVIRASCRLRHLWSSVVYIQSHRLSASLTYPLLLNWRNLYTGFILNGYCGTIHTRVPGEFGALLCSISFFLDACRNTRSFSRFDRYMVSLSQYIDRMRKRTSRWSSLALSLLCFLTPWNLSWSRPWHQQQGQPRAL